MIVNYFVDNFVIIGRHCQIFRGWTEPATIQGS